MTVKLKSDKFRKVRGGHSRFLDVCCEHCEAKVLVYQKDGPGILKRIYLDRIFAPESLVNLQHLAIDMVPNLVCLECETVLGVPFVYKKEKRNAFRLFVGAVTKKVVKM